MSIVEKVTGIAETNLKKRKNVMVATNEVTEKKPAFDESDHRFDAERRQKFFRHFETIGTAWERELNQYCDVTKDMFGREEFPWDRAVAGNERVMVSTLTTAIARTYPDAIIAEELPVTKGASIDKKSDDGRSDLWCSIRAPDSRYSFYLEAKMTITPRNTEERLLEIFFKHKNSILTRAFKDYQKSHGKAGDVNRKLVSTSPYSRERRHAHDFVALSIASFECAGEDAFDNLAERAKENFSIRQPIHLTTEQKLNRHLGKHPTVVVVVSRNLELPNKVQATRGMLAAFTLMASAGG